MDEDKKTIVNMIVQKYQLIEDKPFEINRGNRKAVFSERFMLHNNQIHMVRTYWGRIESKKSNNMDQVVGMLLFRDDLEIEYVELRPISLLSENVKSAIRYVANHIDGSFKFRVDFDVEDSWGTLVFFPHGYTIPLDKKAANDIERFAWHHTNPSPTYFFLTEKHIDALLNATTDKYEIKIEE